MSELHPSHGKGKPQRFSLDVHRERGGMSFESYKVQFQKALLNVEVQEMPDGKIEQYQVSAAH